MPRKEIEPIISIGDQDKLTVQKSLPLFSIWKSELTLVEFKILDIYLSRINSHKPEERVVIFGKGELENILGVKKINNKELKERLKHLMSNVVEIPDVDEKNGFRLITLFEESVAEQDDCGLWQIKLACTQQAMKYIFNIENLGYLRYKLRCITSISSRYTYIMFMYLESNRFRKSWEIPLQELKVILNCDKEEVYKEYKRFNDRLLKRVHKEMHEKTECKYTYESVKKGRSVVAIRFTIQTLPKVVEQPLNPLLDMDPEKQDNKNFWINAVEEYNFSPEQLDELDKIIICIPESKLPSAPAVNDDIEIRRYHYIDQKIAEIKRRRNIKNVFAYLLKMIKQDVKQNVADNNNQNKTVPFSENKQITKSKNKFKNFDERERSDRYYVLLEKVLRGVSLTEEEQEEWELEQKRGNGFTTTDTTVEISADTTETSVDITDTTDNLSKSERRQQERQEYKRRMVAITKKPEEIQGEEMEFELDDGNIITISIEDILLLSAFADNIIKIRESEE